MFDIKVSWGWEGVLLITRIHNGFQSQFVTFENREKEFAHSTSKCHLKSNDKYIANSIQANTSVLHDTPICILNIL